LNTDASQKFKHLLIFRFRYWDSKEDDASASDCILAFSRAANMHLKIQKGEETQSWELKAGDQDKREDRVKILKNWFISIYY